MDQEYDITVYFDVPAGSPLYGIGFTYRIEAESSLDPKIESISAELIGSDLTVAEVEVSS